MSEYVVTWQITLDASSALAAAREALAIHRDPTSISTVFVVQELGIEGNGPAIPPVLIDLGAESYTADDEAGT